MGNGLSVLESYCSDYSFFLIFLSRNTVEFSHFVSPGGTKFIRVCGNWSSSIFCRISLLDLNFDARLCGFLLLYMLVPPMMLLLKHTPEVFVGRPV